MMFDNDSSSESPPWYYRLLQEAAAGGDYGSGGYGDEKGGGYGDGGYGGGKDCGYGGYGGGKSNYADPGIDYSVLSVTVMTLGLIIIVEVVRHKIDHSAHGRPFFTAVLETLYNERTY